MPSCLSSVARKYSAVGGWPLWQVDAVCSLDMLQSDGEEPRSTVSFVERLELRRPTKDQQVNAI